MGAHDNVVSLAEFSTVIKGWMHTYGRRQGPTTDEEMGSADERASEEKSGLLGYGGGGDKPNLTM